LEDWNFGDGDAIQFDQKGGFMLFNGKNTAYNLNDTGQFLWGDFGHKPRQEWVHRNERRPGYEWARRQ